MARQDRVHVDSGTRLADVGGARCRRAPRTRSERAAGNGDVPPAASPVGVSVILFPEGTRAPSRELLPFKDGAFRLAIDAGVPILPLAIYGTRNAIARHDWRINPATAMVEVLEPEPTAGTKRAGIETAGPGEDRGGTRTAPLRVRSVAVS